MSVSDCEKMRDIVKLRMKLHAFDLGIFMVTTNFPRLLPVVSCPAWGDSSCNRLGNYYPSPYEVENKELALVET